MSTKITLITPPDFYETGNLSILLAHLTDEEQTAVSDWLGKHDLNENINLYFMIMKITQLGFCMRPTDANISICLLYTSPSPRD